MNLLSIKKKNKMIFVGILSFIVLLVFVYFITFIYGSYIIVENYSVREIIVQDNSLHFKGTTISSAQAFSGYKYKFKNGDVYIKIRYSLASRFNKSGDCEINIVENFANINNVYLQGMKKDDIRLIWSR